MRPLFFFLKSIAHNVTLETLIFFKHLYLNLTLEIMVKVVGCFVCCFFSVNTTRRIGRLSEVLSRS